MTHSLFAHSHYIEDFMRQVLTRKLPDGIKVRVAFLQGKMDIDSQPGTGTTILIESPII